MDAKSSLALRKNPLSLLIDCLGQSGNSTQPLTSVRGSKTTLNEALLHLAGTLQAQMEFGNSHDIFQQQYLIEQQLQFKAFIMKMIRQNTLTHEHYHTFKTHFEGLKLVLSKRWAFHTQLCVDRILHLMSEQLESWSSTSSCSTHAFETFQIPEPETF